MKVWIVTHKSRPPQHPRGKKMGEMITPAAGRVHVHARTHLKEPCPVPKTPCGTRCGHPKGLGSATLPPHHGDGGTGTPGTLTRLMRRTAAPS